ncbi:MAG TPA: fluoride efflux transporter CrcB [Gaiellaceae bacterium]|nr:fluoride efflux transporter CrcB [Gaiellaceae bacterium]
MSAPVWIGVALLGGAGAILRFRLDAFVQLRTAGELPLGTLAVNLTGSLALGALHGGGVGGDALFLAGTAFLGSFTTFSTWMLETQRLVEDGDDRVGALDLVLPLALGLAAVLAGWAIGAAV